MPYKYLDHIGDAAIEATGKTMEEVFAETARAMFHLMVPGKTLSPDLKVGITVRADSREDLLVGFLNELLAQQGLNNCVFTNCSAVKTTQLKGNKYILNAMAEGISVEGETLELGAEVKAASLAGLKVEEGAESCRVRCVLDL